MKGGIRWLWTHSSHKKTKTCPERESNPHGLPARDSKFFFSCEVWAGAKVILYSLLWNSQSFAISHFPCFEIFLQITIWANNHKKCNIYWLNKILLEWSPGTSDEEQTIYWLLYASFLSFSLSFQLCFLFFCVFIPRHAACFKALGIPGSGVRGATGVGREGNAKGLHDAVEN